jgi:hypothetical protein
MARRPEDDRKSLQKNGNAQDRDREQREEKEETAQKEVEPEHARLQNQMGNQGVNALIATQNAAGGGRGGVEVEMAKRPAEVDKEGQDYGGIDDGDPFAAGLGDSDLFAGWTPGTTQPTERAEFIEPMPEDALPPEDEAFLAAAHGSPTAVVESIPPTLEMYLQPSLPTLTRSMRGWGQALQRWSTEDALLTVWAHTLIHPPPLLQAPDGRALLSRARTASLATLLAASLPALRSASPGAAQAITLHAELESCAWAVRSPRLTDVDPRSRPTATDLFIRGVGEPRGTLENRFPGVAMHAALDEALRGLLRLADPLDLVPRLAPPSASDPDDDDDPYGVEAVLREMTGGEKDPSEAPQRAIIQGAERLAGGLQLTRYRFAGVAVAVREALSIVGLETDSTLLSVLSVVDESTQALLQRLRTVARAAQQRQQSTASASEQLGAIARELGHMHTEARQLLIEVVGGAMPDAPLLLTADGPPPAWRLALEDGQTSPSLESLLALPRSRHRDVAIALTEFSTAVDPDGWTSRFQRLLLPESSEPLDRALQHWATACALRSGAWDDAFQRATSNVRHHATRRNGVGGAAATLDGIEALHAQQAPRERDEWRHAAARAMHDRGWTAAVSLIARWAPPED